VSHPCDPVWRLSLRGAVVLAAVAVAAVGGAAEEGNRLPDPSFEDLDAKTVCPAGWHPWAAENTAVYSLAAARTGLACAAVTDASPQVSQGLRSARVEVEPGRTYEASVWVYIEHAEAGGFSVYLEYWTGEARIADFSVGTDVVGKWMELRTARPAPAGARTATVLIYGSSATVGRALFDDACLSEKKDGALSPQGPDL